MKTISGNLVSVQPILLSKAARYISDFASFENNGVSDVVCIYLNHASESFNSLVQLNKDLKHPQSSHKKHRRKSISEKNNACLRNDETMNYDDGERRIRSRDEKQGELLNDEKVGVIKKEYSSARISGIEDMRTSKKKRKEKNHTTDSVEAEDSISSELRKGGKNGGNEVGDMVNPLVDLRKNNKKKNGNNQEGLKMEENVDGESNLKDNSVEPTRKKRKRSKVLDD